VNNPSGSANLPAILPHHDNVGLLRVCSTTTIVQTHIGTPGLFVSRMLVSSLVVCDAVRYRAFDEAAPSLIN
jgi:hypothetical protein